MKIFVLLPLILLTRIAVHFDPHLFRYWDLTSLEQWRRLKTTRTAYVIGVAGWVIFFGAIYFLVRWF
jgi:hypothetical protein